jgi:microcystin-dependent protein
MSFLRSKRQVTNKTVYTSNRLATFNTPPIRTGDLVVEEDLHVGRDLYLNSYLLIPYGTIIQCAAVNIPGGWLLCDGSSLSKTGIYENLFGAILYTYGGSGDNFNVPDMRGRVTVGTSEYINSSRSQRVLGDTGGEENHTLTTSEMPSHTHGSNADGTTTARLSVVDGNDTMNAAVNSGSGEPNLYTNTTLTISNTGGGQSHNNMQPFIVLRYLIKY